MDAVTNSNFGFLAVHDPALADVAGLAERYFAGDPVTCLMKVRQLGELLAQQVAARAGVLGDADEPQAELLGRLRRETAFPRDVIDLFHDLRRVGNEAVHKHRGDHRTALAALKVARQLAVWFHRTFGDRAFRAGPFEPPRAPPDPTAALREELDRLRSELPAAQEARLAAETAEAARRTAQESARLAAEERAIWEALATDSEARLLEMHGELAELQAKAAAAAPVARQAIVDAAVAAAQAIDLDEQATRAIIDERLRTRGWEADTASMRHADGARPVAGRNRAIAEWPTATGPADYALFVGLLCVGVVEAKRSRKNVAAAIDQAGRYSQGFSPEPGIALPVGGPWAAQSGEATQPPYRVPFLFATNGHGYLKQLETQSGIWHWDARDPTNRRRALADWPTPDGLKAMLDIDRVAASAALTTLPFDFAFGLRDYQMRGIQAVEAALADDGRRWPTMGGAGRRWAARAATRDGDWHREDQARRGHAVSPPAHPPLPPDLLRGGPHRARRPGEGRVHDHPHRQRPNLRRYLRSQGAGRHRARLGRLIDHAAGLLASGAPVMLAGDFNVMPADLDVYKPERWRKDALFAPEARAAFARLPAQGWTDAIRATHPDEAIYTFWDYFRDAYGRDAGLRIDHLLLSPALAGRLTAAGVDAHVRGWEDASDHAPAWVELADPPTRRRRPRAAGPAPSARASATARVAPDVD